MKTANSEQLNMQNKAVRSFMVDMLIMLTVVSVVSVYTYGTRALWTIVLSVSAAVITEVLGYVIFLRSRPERITDLSAVFTGMAIALTVSSAAPLWLAPLGAVFAIAVAKLPFGNANTTPFVPAAAGIAFISVSFKDLMFTYPSLSIGSLEISSKSEGFIQGTSIAEMLMQSKSIGTNILNVLDVLVGRIPGPIGASCFLLMLATFVYMIIRKHPGTMTTASFIAVCCVMAVLFPRILTGRTYSLLMELSSGTLLFSAVFFISDPATSPKTQLGKVLYGFCAGVLTMLIRYFGALEDGACFAVLIMNAISGEFDGIAAKISQTKSSKRPRLKKSNVNREGTSLPNNPIDTSKEGGILDNE
ncbi:MAG: RnfABCDGE type electron transport complex subunit D [Oscillospiraceae bacterium]|nr:RnfABCDGE type electron transport complex subunit D [Oscillospiraceae bacterium]